MALCMAGYDCRLVPSDLAGVEGDVTEKELREQAEELRHVHIYGRFFEALRLLTERVEEL